MRVLLCAQEKSNWNKVLYTISSVCNRFHFHIISFVLSLTLSLYFHVYVICMYIVYVVDVVLMRIRNVFGNLVKLILEEKVLRMNRKRILFCYLSVELNRQWIRWKRKSYMYCVLCFVYTRRTHSRCRCKKSVSINFVSFRFCFSLFFFFLAVRRIRKHHMT